MLMEQFTVQEREIEENRRELDERDAQLNSLSQSFNNATIVVQKLKEACHILQTEKHSCEQSLQEYAATKAQLILEKNTAMDTIDIYKEAQKGHRVGSIEYLAARLDRY